MDFDFTANYLNMPELDDSATDEARRWWTSHQDSIVEELGLRYGQEQLEAKVQNLKDIDAQPFSVISFHNHFYRQARHAFIVGAYYPSLTATVALGERILNELVLGLRSDFPVPKDRPKIGTKKSFNNWKLMIDALEEWEVLLPDVVAACKRLEKIRQSSVHFNPLSHDQVRSMAVEAILAMNLIINRQFGILGNQPWFIPDIRGASYIRQAYEQHPFIRRFILPHCGLVGPKHRLNYDEHTGLWSVTDETYEADEVTDEEFRDLLERK